MCQRKFDIKLFFFFPPTVKNIPLIISILINLIFSLFNYTLPAQDHSDFNNLSIKLFTVNPLKNLYITSDTKFFDK